MNPQNTIELNRTRWKTQLSNLIDNIRPEHLTQFKTAHIYDSSGKEVKLSDIDFSTPLLFISTIDFSYLISVFGLLKLNNIPYEDLNYSGNNSRIRTTYMMVNSFTIRNSGLDWEESYKDLPEDWNPINFETKQLCMWRLVKEVGQGINEKMYNYSSERIYNRYMSNHNDWVFFLGTPEEYKQTYNIPVNFNTYRITLFPIQKDTKGGKVF